MASGNVTGNVDVNHAIDCHRHGAQDEAQAICLRILERDPGNSDALNLLGVIAKQKGDTRMAVQYLLQAIDADQNVPVYHANLGALLIGFARYDDAVIALESCLLLEPDNLAGLINLADAFNRLKQFNQAETVARRAVNMAPDHPDALNNLGIALKGLNLREQAQQTLERALTIQPDHADTWNSLGVLHMGMADIDRAIDALREAVRCSPAHAQAHFGLGMCLLTRGDFDEGAREYEWRWRTREFTVRDFGAPKWDGSDLKGKSVLLYAEQGFGDVIQFTRFAPTLAAMGARVVMEVQPQLAGLIGRVSGVSAIVSKGDPLPPIDWHAPLLSLMHLLDLHEREIPAQVPYLAPMEQTVAAWRARLKRADGKYRVGIVWAGNPGHRNDANRSMSLDCMAPLLNMADVAFYSLQVGGDPHKTGPSALSKYPSLVNLAPELTDFEETAGALCAMDLLISVDTGVAHLAGALGCPVWMAVPWVPDWRWMLSRADSPWYPTMRLYRQEFEKDWVVVIERMVADLQGLIK